mmetsp:Transcript_54655/g.116130  ORF Transcript_54655/g.116130 Transcript_54655/m.116130 type:complete len:322 (-) Transcript_54655:375-1340(-)
MVLNNRMPFDSSDSEDDAWELVCDDTVPLAASPSQVDATAVPDSFIGDVVESNALRSQKIEPGASSGLENSGDESFATAVSTITDGGHRSSDAKEGEDDANVEEGNHSVAPAKEKKVTTAKLLDLPLEEDDDEAKTEEGVDTLALVEEQESPTGKLLDLPEKPLGSGSWFGRATAKVVDEDVGEEMQAHYDDKLKRWIFPGDDPAEVAKPLAPPPMIPKKKEGATEPPSTPAATAPSSSDPLAMLMAPPPRSGGLASGRRGIPAAAARRYAADPLASMGGGPSNGKKTPASPMAPPTFAVFQPKPASATPSSSEPAQGDED